MRILKEIDVELRDYEVEIEFDLDDIEDELDTDDVKQLANRKLDADDVTDILTDMESYSDLADRIYGCSSMIDAVEEHAEAPEMAARIAATKTTEFADKLKEEFEHAVPTLLEKLGGSTTTASGEPTLAAQLAHGPIQLAETMVSISAADAAKVAAKIMLLRTDLFRSVLSLEQEAELAGTITFDYASSVGVAIAKRCADTAMRRRTVDELATQLDVAVAPILAAATAASDIDTLRELIVMRRVPASAVIEAMCEVFGVGTVTGMVVDHAMQHCNTPKA